MLTPSLASASVHLFLRTSPPVSLARDWMLMVTAMMAPLLTLPLSHVRDRSFARQRARAMVLFAAGYGTIWTAAGIVVIALTLAARLAAPSTLWPAAGIVAFVVAWQFSTVKQQCLNRCHARPALAAFGFAADLGAVQYGLTYGIWCAGSCWVFMMLPMLLSRGHVAAMALVALWFLAERLERPTPPRWRCRVPRKAVRIAMAQVFMPLRRALSLS